MDVLVVDADSHTNARLAAALEQAGFRVGTAASGEEALTSVASHAARVIVLDRELPDIDGLEVCRQVRLLPDRIRIVMFSYAAQTADERVLGLEAGADVYLAEPVVVAELIARLRALGRRDEPRVGQVPLRLNGLMLDPARYELATDAEYRELTPTEYRLLELFMQNPERVLSHQEIERSVWGRELPGSASLRVYVGYVRRKMLECAAGPIIQTVPAKGYILLPR
jgi:two-component system, OmpR family, response regulator MprA